MELDLKRKEDLKRRDEPQCNARICLHFAVPFSIEIWRAHVSVEQ